MEFLYIAVFILFSRIHLYYKQHYVFKDCIEIITINVCEMMNKQHTHTHLPKGQTKTTVLIKCVYS